MFPAQSGYEVECTSLLGVKGENLCEGTANATLTNEAGTLPASVLGVFEEVAISERATCTLTGAESGEILGEGNTWAIGNELERLATAVS